MISAVGCLIWQSFDYFMPENEEFLQTQSHIDPRVSSSYIYNLFLLIVHILSTFQVHPLISYDLNQSISDF